MKHDMRLLTELAELQHSPVLEYLKALRDETIEQWTHAADDRTATMKQGEKRLLDRIIDDISTAEEQKRRLREQEALKIERKHLF